MKEPITERDLLVIGTLCTGFGVLLSWGLFYRWGSLPPSKSIDWSAWVQAIGSVFAIFVAIAIPFAMAHREHQRRIKVQRARAQGYALLTLPATEQYLSTIRSVQWQLRQQNSDSFFEMADKLKIQPDLAERLKDIHELEDAGARLAVGINSADLAAAAMNNYEFYIRYGPKHFDEHTGEETIIDPPTDDFEALILDAAESLQEAIYKMRAYFK